LNITTIYVTHDQEEALSLSDTIAVMRDGRIEQVGTPYEIYNRPRTGFVANFIGVTNRINGTAVRVTKNLIEVKTREGLFEVNIPDDIEIFKEIIPGTSLSLFFRPEQCFLFNQKSKYLNNEKKKTKQKLLELNSTCKNILTGRVISCEYLGESTVIEFDTGHGNYSARLQGLALCRIGEKVNVHVNPSQIWIIE